MGWILVLAVGGALGYCADRYARGRWRLPGLPAPVRTTPATGLPTAPTAADVDKVRFDTALRGYATTAVVAELDRLRERLRDAQEGSQTPEAAQAASSRPLPLAFRGYRTDQVDDVLDRLEASLAEGVEGVEEVEGVATGEGAEGVATGEGAEGVATGEGAERAETIATAEEAATGEGAERAETIATAEEAATAEAVGGVATADAVTTVARETSRTHRRRRRWPGWLTGERRPPDPPRPPWRRWPDALVAGAYAALAAYLLGGLIADPKGTFLSQGVQDQQLFEFYLGASAHNVLTLSNPFFTYLQNYPVGVNLLANTGLLGLGIPLAPLTLVAGPQITFIVAEWLGFFLTALLWYRLFVVRLTDSRPIAALGGLLCGFSPGMVSHGNGHPNFLAQFLVPVIVDRLLELQRPGRTRGETLRSGIVLGLLVTWQLTLGEEVLLLAAIGIAIAGGVLAVHRRLDIRTMLPGTLVGVATTLVLFGFPLWWQFLGPQSYLSLWQPPGDNDLASLWGRATRTFFADPWAAAALSLNRTEENAFLGVPVWLVVVGVVVLLWRRPLVRACAAVILLASWVSLGSTVTLHGSATGLPSLWALAERLPLVHLVLPTRFTLVAVPAVAALLVTGLDEALRRWRSVGWATPVAWGAAVVAVLPLAPTPLVADPRPPVPAFFASGAWRAWVHDGSVLPVPPGDIVDMRSTDWQATARWAFPLPEGYFVGPDGSGTGGGQRGAIARPLSTWLREIGTSGIAEVPTPEQRRRFVEDLRVWRVDVVVLPADREQATVLLASVESFLGPATTLGGAHVWDVRRMREGRL